MNKILFLIEKYKWILILAGVAGISIFYSIFNPYKDDFLPKCAFHTLTGYQCPGCGSQRAIHNLLHLKIYQAIKENMLLILSIPYLLIGAYFDIFKPKTQKSFKLQKILFGLPAIWIVFFIIIIYWIVRNLEFYKNIFK